jgi:hypothetical protein
MAKSANRHVTITECKWQEASRPMNSHDFGYAQRQRPLLEPVASGMVAS